MSQLTERLERDLREVAAGAHPSPAAWESIEARLGEDAGSEVVPVPTLTRDRSKRSLWPAVAAAVLVVVIGSIAVLTRAGDDHSISTAELPNLTTTFVSPRNGFSVKYVDRGERTVTPASQVWGFTEGADDEFDVVETGVSAVFKGASTELAALSGPGRLDERVDEQLSDDRILPDGCGVPRRQQGEITIDGRSGRVAECPNHIEATVVVSGRLYLFTLAHDRSDARAVFDAFVATIDLTPATAVDFPGLTTTFVSPTYGYSFGYLDRGGLAPATGRWDPADEQVDNLQIDDRFDAVETGLGAYFVAASTAIPEGVATDDWYDEHVSVSGCGAPRSQQAEVTIDGQPGRVAECGNQIEATVVAGGRLYLFMLGHSRTDGRELFDAWLATIDLTPETAATP